MNVNPNWLYLAAIGLFVVWEARPRRDTGQSGWQLLWAATSGQLGVAGASTKTNQPPITNNSPQANKDTTGAGNILGAVLNAPGGAGNP